MQVVKLGVMNGYKLWLYHSSALREGIRGCCLSVMNDKCCQPKGKAFVSECVTSGICTSIHQL